MILSIDEITNWINNSGLVETTGPNMGGVHSYFDQKKHNFGFLYPEITGYFISTQRFLFNIKNEQSFKTNAENSSNWLIKVFEKFGGIIQGIDTEKSRGNLVYTFDSAICANGILDAYLLTKNEKFLQFSKSICDWIVDETLNSDGTIKPYKNLETNNFEEDISLWYKQTGCLHIKIAMPLAKLYYITNDKKYLEKSSLICNSINNYQNIDGSILLHSNKKTIHMHSLCYALEGLLYNYGITKNSNFLDRCIKCLKWCQNKISDNDMMLWHNSNYEKSRTSYHISQLIRLMILTDLENNSHIFDFSIEKLCNFLLSFQIHSKDQKSNGGFYEEYYKTLLGWKIRKRVNSWGTFFALQAIYWKNNKNSISFNNEISFLY